MDVLLLGVFCGVYAGMLLGGVPGLALDRTGVALMGAIVLLGAERVSPMQAWDSIDVPTMGLLFGLMVVSAQFRLGGFYTALTRALANADVRPSALLAILLGVAALLSALLCNDIVCLAMAPILVEGCRRKRLDPLPFLLGLACASNIGSAATLIGNPQNLLIGQSLKLSFSGYFVQALTPTLLGLVALWIVLCLLTRGRWERAFEIPKIESPPYNSWQSSKGVLVLSVLVAAFFVSDLPREVLALAAAGLLLASRRMHTRNILGLVDWHLLVLFAGLFIVNHALQASGMLDTAMAFLRESGVPLEHPGWLFGAAVALSNLVSNVPATMLLLPAATHPMAGPILAIASTLAGNLIIVGSIANIIVVEQAARLGVRISWRVHARVGVPVTVVTLMLAAACLWIQQRVFG